MSTARDDHRSWIVDRIGAPAFDQLARGLTGSELQSLLLEVMGHRARRRTPGDLLAQYERDGFCAPAAVDPRDGLAIDAELLAAAARFEALELSPVAPLGACSAIALTDQNRVLTALRGTEVVSDPTNVLALECSRRFRRRPGEPIHLATSQRVLRAQPVPRLPGHAPHFRIFVLSSGGRESREHGFTVETILLHIRTLLDGLDRLERRGYAFGARRVDVLATTKRERIADRVAEALGGIADRQPFDHPYYSGGLRFQIRVTAPDGSQVPLVDGGTFDWLAKLAANRRAVFVATGAGSQLIALQFRAARAE